MEKVYFTRNITEECLVKRGKVAVKISTGELGGQNYLKP